MANLDDVDDTIAAGTGLNHDTAVRDRYAGGARAVEQALCCPVEDYDQTYLTILPQEMIDKDYGCGDPSKYVGPGETVVDLGSGTGKICYILSQKVGSTGRVIGIDFNDAMFEVARRYRPELSAKIGYDNVSFHKGRIQDLRLDLDAAGAWLAESPVSGVEELDAFEQQCNRLRAETPMVPSAAVDVVVSNCVLNLVRPDHKKELFGEIFRVLKDGGRAVISDIVCDELPTQTILNDPELWSGCIAGAFLEHEFLAMFAEAGFYGIEILSRQQDAWQVVDGIEFRSLTVRAFKGKQGPCLERNQAVVYRGPFSQVQDDDRHTYYRGERMAVCDKTHRLLTSDNGPYAGMFDSIEPRETVALEQAEPFDCTSDARRDPRQTKGQAFRDTQLNDGPVCGPDGCC